MDDNQPNNANPANSQNAQFTQKTQVTPGTPGPQDAQNDQDARSTPSNTDSQGATHATNPANQDLQAWRDKVGQTVEKSGFIEAWKLHLPEILQFHNLRAFGDSLLRDILYSWMNKDPQLHTHFMQLPQELLQQLAHFLTQEATTPGSGAMPSPANPLTQFYDMLQDHSQGLTEVRESDGTPVLCLHKSVFQNWGRTVENTPALTCFPKSKTGVCNLVRWANEHHKAVRAAGYRHSWSQIFSEDDQILISMLPLDVVEVLPGPEPGIDPSDQLQGIELVGHFEEEGMSKALCRIGAATTNEQFRRWCLDRLGGNWQWTVPTNAIVLEATWAGTIATISHGAGRRFPPVSDLVTEIEFVNAKGELQVINDPEQLTAAAGNLGLLGIVTSLTVKVVHMTYAAMQPTKPRVGLAIPPPEGFDIPPGIDMSGITREDLEQARRDFVDHCENDYYAEWFWFSYQPRCWVNTWKNNGRREDAADTPNPLATFAIQMAEFLAQVANTTIFRLLPPRVQTEVLASGAMLALPANQTMVMPLIDGLHFQRGAHNMRVWDMEMEIPIPPRADDPDQPDWSICQKAWWAAIKAIYKRGDTPMRLTMEMRVMADSKVTMAPQHGNHLGTCSIEILTTPNENRQEWLSFMQEMVDAWDSFTDPDGRRLNIRPHWGKQWEELRFRGMPAPEYLKKIAYRESIPEFRENLQSIAKDGGYTLAEQQRLFSNPLLNEVFSEVFRGDDPDGESGKA